MRAAGLLTDFGQKDSFAGIIKAVILNIAPRTSIIDLTHNISSHNIREAAFLLWKSYKYFPEKTVFLTIVDPGVGSKRKALLVQTKNYYFIGPDNGVLSLAAEEDKIEKIVSLENKKFFLKNVSSTFHGRDIFASVCGWLLKGISVEKFGPEVKSIEEIKFPLAKITFSSIEGEVVYIDKFGNLITNIPAREFETLTKGKDFSCRFGRQLITRFYPAYSFAKDRETFFCPGSFSFIEICQNQSSACKQLKAKTGDKVICRIFR